MKTFAIVNSAHPRTELVIDVSKIRGYLTGCRGSGRRSHEGSRRSRWRATTWGGPHHYRRGKLLAARIDLVNPRWILLAPRLMLVDDCPFGDIGAFSELLVE